MTCTWAWGALTDQKTCRYTCLSVQLSWVKREAWDS